MYAGCYDLAVLVMVGEPDECYVQMCSHILQDVLVKTVGFAYLALDAVAVYCMAEMVLGRGGKHAVAQLVIGPVHGAYRVTGDAAGITVLEELADGGTSREPLAFGKAVSPGYCSAL